MAARTDTPRTDLPRTGVLGDTERGDLPSHLHPFLPVIPRRPLVRLDLVLAVALFAASLALYTLTMTRGLNSMSGDSSEMVTKSAMLEIAHSPGSPLYVWLGWLFSKLPFGQIATRVTLLSTVLGAVAVGAAYLVGARFISRNRLAALGAAAAFALSLTFWSQAVIAELYAPNIGLLSVAVWCLLEWSAASSRGDRTSSRRWLVAAAFLYGASLGVHLSNLMFLPVFALFVLLGWPLTYGERGTPLGRLIRGTRSLDLWLGLGAAAVFALALLPYLWQYFNLDRFPAMEGKPTAAPGWPLFYEFTLNAYSFWRFGIPPASWPDRAFLVLHLTQRNFGWLVLPFLIVGIWYLLTRRTRLFYLFGGMALANFVFYGTYKVSDIDGFFIPGYWALIPFVGAGLDLGLSRLPSGVRWRAKRMSWLARALPIVTGLAIAAACVLQWTGNFEVNNRVPDTALRDFYGNVFATVPAGSWIFHRGAALGYDLLYYTRLYHTRPDLHFVAGPQPGETTSPPWPPGPAYATTVRREVFQPAFLSDLNGPNNKWFSPDLMGMFAWSGNVRRSWLTLFRLSPNDSPPPDWLVPADSPQARPRTVLNAAMTQDLTLLGVDVPSEATAGRPIDVTRYWRTTSANLPRIATVLGDHQAVEVHVPLVEQLQLYLQARGIPEQSLPGYVIRDSYRLIIPSSASPGTYKLSVSTVSPQLLNIVLDPAPTEQLLPRDMPVGSLNIKAPQSGDTLDPVHMTSRGPVGGKPQK